MLYLLIDSLWLEKDLVEFFSRASEIVVETRIVMGVKTLLFWW